MDFDNNATYKRTTMSAIHLVFSVIVVEGEKKGKACSIGDKLGA